MEHKLWEQKINAIGHQNNLKGTVSSVIVEKYPSKYNMLSNAMLRGWGGVTDFIIHRLYQE